MYDPHLGPNPNTMYDPDFKPSTKPYQKYDPPGPEQLILVYHPNHRPEPYPGITVAIFLQQNARKMSACIKLSQNCWYPLDMKD